MIKLIVLTYNQFDLTKFIEGKLESIVNLKETKLLEV